MRRSHPSAALVPGDHVCWVFDREDDYLDAIGGYLRAGLEAGQRVVHFVDQARLEPVDARLAGYGIDVGAVRASGQFRSVSAGAAYQADSGFDPELMLGQVREQIADGRRDGWPVVRIAGDMTWAQGTVTPDELAGYEARINTVMVEGEALGICLYDRARFEGPVLAAASAAHPGTILPELDGADPLLRMRSKPGGLRLTGEVDLSNADAFAAVLTHARERMDPALPIEVDAAGLDYLDLAAIRQLFAAARSHAAGVMVKGASQMLADLIEACRIDPLSRLLVHPAPGGRAEEIA